MFPAVNVNMTNRETVFRKSAVGIAWLNPEDTGYINIGVNPNTGAIVLAQAHTIRLRGSGVPNALLNELGTAASALISEYLSSYLTNAVHNDQNIQVTEPAFRDLLGQTISGLDQLLIETATSGNDGAIAYHLGKQDTSPPQSTAPSSRPQTILSKITNSLEAVVYFKGGIHLSHRGESQQYLVAKRVQKVTQDHISGGLFGKIGPLGDFIPQIHSKTLAMKPKNRLVIFSRDAAVSSFPLNQLKNWLGDGEPKEQAQRVAEELKKIGKKSGCVLVFAPDWQGGATDDIASHGVFSLGNLANLEKKNRNHFSAVSAQPTEDLSANVTYSGFQTRHHKQNKQKTKNRNPQKNSGPTSMTKSLVENTQSYLSNNDPFQPSTTGRGPLRKADVQQITKDVLAQLSPRMDNLEKSLQNKLEQQFVDLQKDVSSIVNVESKQILARLTDENLPGLEMRIQAQLQGEFSHLESQLREMMELELGNIETDAIKEFSQGTLNAKSVLENHTDSPANRPIEEIDTAEVEYIEEDSPLDTAISQASSSQRPTAFPTLPPLQMQEPRYTEETETDEIFKIHPSNRKIRFLIIAGTLALAAVITFFILFGIFFDATSNKSPSSTSTAKPISKSPDAAPPEVALSTSTKKTKAISNATTPIPSMQQQKLAVPQKPISSDKAQISNRRDLVPRSLSVKQLYVRGLELYLMGDLGKTKNKKRLSKTERYEALTSALAHLEVLSKQGDSAPPNTWYLKGRTRYTLAKLEPSKTQKVIYAKQAISDYMVYETKEAKISKAKKKTIKRNRSRLKKLFK